MHRSSILDTSLKGLWKVSYPLIFTFLATSIMLFIDRLLLAHYSTEALSAATSAINISWAIISTWVTMATMAEVFVAQYNGAKKYHLLGKPAWQMIWMSIFSIGFFIPLALFASRWICGGSSATAEEIAYLQPMMFFGPSYVLLFGISAFFIGQGKTWVINWLAIFANILNAFLAWIFIFGVPGLIPEMGIAGAAIATGISVSLQALVLLVVFLNKHNRTHYGSADWKISPSLLLSCIRLGAPPSILLFMECFSWAIFYKILKTVSPGHILVASICQSILLLFLFFGWGIEKGVAAIAGNLIGAQKSHQISSLFRSGLQLTALFGAFLLVLTLALGKWAIALFMDMPALHAEHALSPESFTNVLSLSTEVFIALIFMNIYLFFENTRWVMGGILTSAGDTLFLVITGTCSIFLFLLLPTYYLSEYFNPSFSVLITACYSFLTALLFLFRVKSNRWKKNMQLV